MDDLIKTLQNKKYFNHAVEQFNVIQTHISWVILTGQYAYKIKKPVNLGFQDFTTIEKRKYFCDLEIKLNKRLAPELYLDVIPITGTPAEPTLNGSGPAFEYAIKMKEFSQAKMLSHLAEENQITEDIIKDIATQFAHFHKTAEIAKPTSEFGSYESIIDPMIDNFTALKQMPFAQIWSSKLEALENKAKLQAAQLKDVLLQRKANGWIKACHGDAHLGNMALINGKVVIFDCIEFNENFRWTDVFNDVGFFLMDLHHKKLSQLSQVFINHYLEQSGDYEGAILLNFYAAYRAMVRAKVSGFQLAQTDKNDPRFLELTQELEDFIKLASHFYQDTQPNLCITYGVSASGKSYYTDKLIKQNNTIRLRSDVIRKQLFDIPLYQKTPATKIPEVYSEQATQKVYEKMHRIAKLYLQNGFTVLIDAACLKSWQRQLFATLASKTKVSFKILTFDTNVDILKSRLQQRNFEKNEASDATPEILDLQLNTMEPLTSDERPYAVAITQESLAC